MLIDKIPNHLLRRAIVSLCGAWSLTHLFDRFRPLRSVSLAMVLQGALALMVMGLHGLSAPAGAAEYPEKPIRFLVPISSFRTFDGIPWFWIVFLFL